jgi:hypothetical protein
MKPLEYSILVISFCLLVPCVSQAEDPGAMTAEIPNLTIEERVKLDKVEKRLTALVDRTNHQCETRISSSLALESFQGKRWNRNLVTSMCSDAIAALRTLCRNELARERIQNTISTYTCSLAETGPRSMSLKEGNLMFRISLSEKNNLAFSAEWLEKNL